MALILLLFLAVFKYSSYFALTKLLQSLFRYRAHAAFFFLELDWGCEIFLILTTMIRGNYEPERNLYILQDVQ